MELSKQDWDIILLRVKNKMDLYDITFETWLKPLMINKIEGTTIFISAADVNSAQIVTERYYTQIIEELKFYLKNNSIELVIKAADLLNLSENTEEFSKNEIEDFNNNAFLSNINYNYIDANLNENYTFESFVKGNNNSFACEAAKAVAKDPGCEYNPLFIYGGVGLGKTHLMQSIAHYVLRKDPKKKVFYITSEFFTNDLIDAIGRNNNASINEFREKYRNNDILLIDDIQFIIDKEGIQDEFFHTFNTLYQNHKQIVISSDRPPKELKTLNERITSRFSQGLIADIIPPDYEMRVAILKKKEELEKIFVDDDVLKYIASNITANVRELEGALTKVIAFSNIEKCELTVDFAKTVLKDMVNNKSTDVITPQKIISVVARHFRISPSEITGKSRVQSIADARHIATYLIKSLLPDMKMTAIADFMNKKTHTTILASSNNIENKLKQEEDLFEKPLTNTIDLLIKQINEY